MKAIRVLIADDEPHIRKLVGRIVLALGGQVVAEARDGEEAVRLFEMTAPDMVILDINMPSMTGDRALARIKALDARVIPIMMTAQDTVDAVQDCLALGAREYILKSNAAEQIFQLLRGSWAGWAREVSAAQVSPC